MYGQKQLLKELSTVAIIDAAQFKSLPADKLVEVSIKIADLKNAGKEIKILSDLSDYTSLKIIKQNAASNKCLKEHIEYYTGKEINENDFAVITNYANAQKALNDFFETTVDPNIEYPFAEIPEDYETGLENIEFKQKLMRRGNHTIGYTAFEILWKECLKIWLYKQQAESFYVRASGSNNRVSIYRDRVSIGCQSVPRFQVEQIALKLNLPFKTE